MINWGKLAEKLTKVPWSRYITVMYISFVSAAMTSLGVLYLLAPGGDTSTKRSSLAPVGDDASLAQNIASLSDKDIEGIKNRNIFNSDEEEEGKDAAAATEPTVLTDEIAKSDLPVKLHGTIYGGDPYTGIAMVENTQERKINSIMVEETLMRDAIVKEILRERIIIDRGGRREYIEIERPDLKPKRRKGGSAKPTTTSGPSIMPLAVEPPPDEYKEDGFERAKNKIQMTEDYRQKLITSDFAKVLQDAKATPNMVEGQLRGFKLTRIRQDSIYEKAGLQNDDIIEEINGVPLTDTAQAIRLLQSLRNAQEIEVRLMRGGGSQTVTLTVN